MTEKQQQTTMASTFFDKQRQEQKTQHNRSVDAVHKQTQATEDQALESEVQTERLSPEAKRAMVSLMRAGSIVASQKPKLFEQLCRHQKKIERHLADMYLRLLLDDRTGIALVLQQEVAGDGANDDDDNYTLIARRTLSLYDTLLLLVLRKYYQEREAAGEQRVIIDIERIEAHLMPFLVLTNSSKSDRYKLNGSLAKMSARKILGPVRTEDGRYEITPVIRYVVNAEFLEHLLNKYKKLANDKGLAKGASDE